MYYPNLIFVLSLYSVLALPMSGGGNLNSNPEFQSTLWCSSHLYYSLPNQFHSKSIFHIKALLFQTDSFSCGYRALFHALCIETAAQEAKAGARFEHVLVPELANNKNWLNIGHQINDLLKELQPTFESSEGLTYGNVLNISQKNLIFQEKLLPLFFDNHRIYSCEKKIQRK